MTSTSIQLGDVVKVDRKAASESECRSLPFVGLEHIEKDTGLFDAGYRRQPESLLATKFRFTPEHVLYGKLRPYLNKVVLPSFDGVSTTEILPLRPDKERLDRTYLYFLLRSPRFVAWASHNVSGANLPRLDPETLQEFSFSLPLLAEQKAVAAALQASQALIHARRCALQLCDEFLPAAFCELLCRNGSNCQDGLLGDYLDFVTSGSRGWAEYYAPTGARFIRSLDVQMNYISNEDAVFVEAPKNAEADRTRVQANDVLLTITGSRIGRVASAPAELAGAFISQHVAILRLNREMAPRYLAAYLSLRSSGQREIARLQYGQTKPGLNLDQIREMRVIVPTTPVQAKLVELLDKFEDMRRSHIEALRQADHLLPIPPAPCLQRRPLGLKIISSPSDCCA
jgi:type I restriction enzyme, S subunit